MLPISFHYFPPVSPSVFAPSLIPPNKKRGGLVAGKDGWRAVAVGKWTVRTPRPPFSRYLHCSNSPAPPPPCVNLPAAAAPNGRRRRPRHRPRGAKKESNPNDKAGTANVAKMDAVALKVRGGGGRRPSAQRRRGGLVAEKDGRRVVAVGKYGR